jgi:hypothetical protein
MVERYAVKTSKTYKDFLDKNKEVKFLSFEVDSINQNGRLWIEDKFGNMVLFLTSIPDKLILEVRCYLPYDPSLILFLLVKGYESKIILLDNVTCWRNPVYYDDDEFFLATGKFLQQLKKTKRFKMYCK